MFSVFLYPEAKVGIDEYEMLDMWDCWWVHLPRVPGPGEEVSVFLKKGDCDRETVFSVYRVTTVLGLEEPYSFRVHMRTEDSVAELEGYDFDDGEFRSG
jgi:hypothetical protein